MKPKKSLLVWMIGFASSWAGPAYCQDVLHLLSGESHSGKVLHLTEKGLVMRIILSGRGVSGSSKRTFARADIDHVVFEHEQLLNDPISEANLKHWKDRWISGSRLVNVPNSDMGGVGLRLARYLADHGSLVLAKRCVATVAREDWNPRRRSKAQALQLRLRWLGKDERGDVVRECLSFLSEDQVATPVWLEAHTVLGLSDFEALRILEKEHPRWEEDDEVRPERNRLFTSAVDHFLAPALFHGAATEESAEGMERAAQVYSFVGKKTEADQLRHDLVRLYPESQTARKQARHKQKSSDTENPSTPKTR